ncbi:hypothetical protein KM043_004155 [Ampulex compressa]|nr:hypothetical protein KM043_004155 [Ampulex compressa]
MHDIEQILRNITLSFPTILIVLKTLMFRWKIHELLPILISVKKDIKGGMYRTDYEKEKIVWYNVAATLFTTSSVLSLFFVPTIFYAKPIVGCILSRNINCSLPYDLPMRIDFVYEVTETHVYALYCVYLIPVATLLTVGATGADSLLVTLTFYLCSQLSILASRVRGLDLKSKEYRCEMSVLVRRHAELLGLATNLGNAFSSLLFVQTLGLIFSLCIVAYQLLLTTEDGEKIMKASMAYLSVLKSIT